VPAAPAIGRSTQFAAGKAGPTILLMSDHSERDWIAEIRKRCGSNPRVPIGIGDDAALIRSDGGVLVTTDMLMDGVDFLVGQTPTELIGRKCLAVNLSDIAAMAGQPTIAVVSLALPEHGGRALAEGLYDGLLKLAEEFGVSIAGGDTNSWDGPLVVSVTLMGEPTSRGPVTRSGAKPGDWVFVTGPLGGSLPSLRHCTFTPRVREALALHEAASLHAMIDLSDGLATDLSHVAAESGVAIIINGDSVPVHDDVVPDRPAAQRLHHALTDGEDFELAFCVSPEDGRRLTNSPPSGVRLHRIGECASGSGLLLRHDDHTKPLTARGWEHKFD
jgi:thiamine-monophosphate kinase